jgi:hypothetical protein
LVKIEFGQLTKETYLIALKILFNILKNFLIRRDSEIYLQALDVFFNYLDIGTDWKKDIEQ